MFRLVHAFKVIVALKFHLVIWSFVLHQFVWFTHLSHKLVILQIPLTDVRPQIQWKKSLFVCVHGDVSVKFVPVSGIFCLLLDRAIPLVKQEAVYSQFFIKGYFYSWQLGFWNLYKSFIIVWLHVVMYHSIMAVVIKVWWTAHIFDCEINVVLA